MGHGFYRRDGSQYPSVEDWAKDYEKSDRRVAYDTAGGYEISTVFLGLDHSFGGGPPLIFETMVFKVGSRSDMHCERYSSEAEALRGAWRSCLPR
jgi:hypothetical protein